MASMFRSVVGLDIGTSAVKAIVLRGGLRSVQVACATRVEEPGIPLSERLRRLSALEPLRGDDVLTALPGQRVSTRLLTFPAGAAKQLDKVVPFELETQIPFALDQVVVAYQRVSPAGAGEVSVLAAAAPNGDVAQLLEACTAARLEPRRVDLDTAALAPLAVAVPPAASETPGATAVVDLGASKTGVAVVADGRLRFVRTITGGGQAITRAIAQALGLPEAEAEARKRDLQPQAADGGDAAEAAARVAVAHALETLAAELHKTLAAYRQAGGPEVTRLLLVGGGAAQPGVAPFLERTLELPARVVRPRDVPGVGGAAVETLGPEYTPALALALPGTGRRLPGTLDFRQGPFAYRREMAGLKRQLAVSAGLAAAILVLLAVDFYAEYSAKVERYEAVQAQVRQAYRTVVPQGPTPANEALDLRARTEGLEKELSQIGGLAGGRITPLAILAELSTRVPRDIRVDVLELVVEKNQVRLRAETDSFESVDKMKAALLEFEPFTDIQVSDARVNANQTSVGFRFTITLADEV